MVVRSASQLVCGNLLGVVVLCVELFYIVVVSRLLDVLVTLSLYMFIGTVPLNFEFNAIKL
jgi:hypothetical protein